MRFFFVDVAQLIEFMLTTHPAYDELVKVAESRKVNIHQGECLLLVHCLEVYLDSGDMHQFLKNDWRNCASRMVQTV